MLQFPSSRPLGPEPALQGPRPLCPGQADWSVPCRGWSLLPVFSGGRANQLPVRLHRPRHLPDQGPLWAAAGSPRCVGEHGLAGGSLGFCPAPHAQLRRWAALAALLGSQGHRPSSAALSRWTLGPTSGWDSFVPEVAGIVGWRRGGGLLCSLPWLWPKCPSRILGRSLIARLRWVVRRRPLLARCCIAAPGVVAAGVCTVGCRRITCGPAVALGLHQGARGP